VRGRATTRLLIVPAVLGVLVLWVPAGASGRSVPASDRLAAPAPAEPGQLEVSVAPATVDREARDATVRLANPGTAPITHLVVNASAPPGVTVTWPTLRAGGRTLPTLAPGASILVPVTVDGFPAATPGNVTIRVRGTSAGVPVTGVASLSFAAAETPLTLALHGSAAMTDRSPAEITAVLVNSSAVPVRARLTAVAGHHQVRIGAVPAGAPLCLAVAGQGSASVQLQVKALDPVRRGTAALLVTAAVSRPTQAAGCDAPRDPVATVTATQDVAVDLAASDLLPDFLGIPSALVLPGLVAVWAWLSVRRRDEKALGLDTADAARAIWDNKLWLLVAAGISLAVAYLADLVGYVDLLDAYRWKQLASVTVGAGVLAALLSWLVVRVHRGRVPLVNANSGEVAVVRAALRTGPDPRARYRSESGESGLLVHEDRGALVLTPPVAFARPSALVTALRNDDEAAVVRHVRSADFNGHFLADTGWIKAPRVFARGELTREADGDLLLYRDEG
jgi:hypothetical protein